MNKWLELLVYAGIIFTWMGVARFASKYIKLGDKYHLTMAYIGCALFTWSFIRQDFLY